MAKLKPRARIIRTIGDQLISGPEAAIIELVKNSYDADASWIKLEIAPKCDSFTDGLIEISDNGHGMSSNEVERKWFEPATDEKKINPLSRAGTRIMLGAKGIGRFASSRLGTLTTLTTVSQLENTSNQFEKTTLEINWSDFETNKYLDELDIPIFSEKLTYSKKLDIQTGLTLRITDTRIVWTEKNIERLINELRRLVSPKDMLGEFKIFLNLSAFKNRKNLNNPSNFDGDSLLLKALSDDSRLEHSDNDYTPFRLITPYKIQDKSDYVVLGDFDASGEFNGTFSIERGDNIEQKIFIPAPPIGPDEETCGKFQLKIQIYDRETEAVEALFKRMGLDFEKIGVRKARQILNENSGIGVYRNGFRIRPYGNADNDWLTLESRRVQEPSKRIGHTQASGQVIIGNEEETQLIERSSREGFEHNGSFVRLKHLITNVLIRVEEKRFDYRSNAGLSRKPAKDIEHTKHLANLSQLVEAANNLPSNYKKTFLEKIEKESASLTKSLDALDEYQKLLESRSALGFVVARVIHDGRRYLEPISFASKALIDGKDFLFETSKKAEVIRKYYPIHAETISTGVKGLNALFKALDPVSGKKRGKPSNFNSFEIVKETVNFLGDSLIDRGIEVFNEVPIQFIAFGYKGDLQNALLNILDNAIHWLGTIVQTKKEIRIYSEIENQSVLIYVTNNGPLIEESYLSKLFDAGFTLKSEGLGIGLAIAREACRSSKGELYFDHSASDTTFVIEFPLGEDK
jgi:hypothetical protein